MITSDKKRLSHKRCRIRASCAAVPYPTDEEEAQMCRDRIAELKADLAHERRVLEEIERRTNCAHEWIDIRNSIVQSGSMCRKCNKLRAENFDQT